MQRSPVYKSAPASKPSCRGAGSERLFDDLIAWGGATNLEEQIGQHIGAGADYVQIEVFADTYEELLDGYRVAASVVS
jgi:hypothetical protein